MLKPLLHRHKNMTDQSIGGHSHGVLEPGSTWRDDVVPVGPELGPKELWEGAPIFVAGEVPVEHPFFRGAKVRLRILVQGSGFLFGDSPCVLGRA